MNRRVIVRLLGILVCVCLPVVTWAESLRFLVQDQHGSPLAGAVLEVLTPVGAKQVEAFLPSAIMDQQSKRFVPELLVIQTGQQVAFPNSDNIRHHVYSFSPAKPFELRLYSGQPEQPIAFPQQGVVVLGCNIHDAMVGYIYVAASSLVAQSDSEGRGEIPLPQAVDAKVTLGVWHPQQTLGPERLNRISLDDPDLDAQATRLSDGTLVLSVAVAAPASRDTFQARFRASQK